MDFTLIPSMQHFSAVSIAVELWTSQEIRHDLVQFIVTKNTPSKSPLRLEHSNCFKTKALETKSLFKISTKLNELRLPGILKEKVRKLLKPIANEIFEGYESIFPEKGNRYFDYYFDHLHWIPWGRIDKQKTVLSLLNIDYFDFELRYNWCCTYTCGRYDEKVWSKCNKEMKQHAKMRLLASNRKTFQYDNSWRNRRRNLSELIPHLKIKMPNYRRICLTEIVVDNEIEMDFERFWSSSSREKRIDIIDRFVERKFDTSVCCSEVLFFLMTQMIAEQQTIFFEINARFIATQILIDWPRRRELFLPTVLKMIWNSSDPNFDELLFDIGDLGNVRFTDVDESHKLFEIVWFDGPSMVKEIIHRWYWCFVPLFVASMDGKSVRLMLKDVDGELRSNILACVKQTICSLALYEGAVNENLNLLDHFLRDMLSNEDEIRDFKIFIYTLGFV